MPLQHTASREPEKDDIAYSSHGPQFRTYRNKLVYKYIQLRDNKLRLTNVDGAQCLNKSFALKKAALAATLPAQVLLFRSWSSARCERRQLDGQTAVVPLGHV